MEKRDHIFGAVTTWSAAQKREISGSMEVYDFHFENLVWRRVGIERGLQWSPQCWSLGI